MAGLAASFGSGAMTNSIAELENSDCILVTGSNTTETHPVIATFIKRAVRLNNKAIIVIEPRRIDLVKHAALWLRQRPGTDIAVINGLMNLIIQENLHDQAYIAERTENFEALKETVAKYTPEYVEQISGVPAADLRRAARLYGQAKAAAIVYAMGITQHTVGTDNVKTLANLAMLCGNVGIEGGGVNPLRGQNNVQGACDMGGLPNVFSGYQPVTDANARAKMEAAWGVKNLPDWVGLTMTGMVPAIPEGKIKALYIVGENPVISDPDSDHLVKAFQKLDFLVVQDIFLTETAQLADVVLPATTFAEKDGTFSNTERRVARVRQVIPPLGDSRPDWQIIAELSRRLGYPMDYADPEAIFEEIRQVTPSYAGITYARLEAEGGLQWPCPTTEHPGTVYLHRGQFSRGKGAFFAIDHRDPAEMPDADYPLVYDHRAAALPVSYRHHEPPGSGPGGKGPGMPGGNCRRRTRPAMASWMVNRCGLRAAGESWSPGLMVSPKAVAGTIFIPFHFHEAAVNKLTIAALDPVAKIPEYKVCAVHIEKA